MDKFSDLLILLVMCSTAIWVMAEIKSEALFPVKLAMWAIVVILSSYLIYQAV